MFGIKQLHSKMSVSPRLIVILLIFNQVFLYSQVADTVKSQYSWILEEGYRIQEVEFDTSINQFHIYNPIDKFSISNSYLSNIGSEYVSNIFIDELEKPYSDFLPENNFAVYLKTTEKQRFYFSKKPYIELKYIMSNKKRNVNNLDVNYTQNINENINVGLKYGLISSDGIFPRSRASEHALNFFTSYTSNKYSLHAAFVRNKYELLENGGILDSVGLTDPDLSLPQLDSASSTLFKSGFLISQELKFGKTTVEIIDDTLKRTVFTEKGKLNYVFDYEHNYRNYLDPGAEYDFYDSIYIATTWAQDSVSLKKYDNALYYTFKELKIDSSRLVNTFGLAYEIIKNYGFKGFVYINNGDYYKSISVKFNSFGTFNKFRYNIKANYYLQGYKTNNYKGTFKVEKDFGLKRHVSTLNLDLEVSRRVASFMEQYYYSNHFMWDNNFALKDIAKAKFGFSIPDRKFNVEVAYVQFNNYIYFDSLGYPKQLTIPLNVLSARGKKEFKFGMFNSLNKVVWQLADNDEAVSLPELSVYHNLYINWQYKKLNKAIMRLHLGYELFYLTEFDALSFMPATGQFYQKRLKKSGDYPIINVFADLRIKSVLLFFKFENVGSQFLRNSYYYLANNHPLNPTMYKLGVSWRFFD